MKARGGCALRRHESGVRHFDRSPALRRLTDGEWIWTVRDARVWAALTSTRPPAAPRERGDSRAARRARGAVGGTWVRAGRRGVRGVRVARVVPEQRLVVPIDQEVTRTARYQAGLDVRLRQRTAAEAA